MGSTSSVPWCNVPPRSFPARGWLEAWVKERYPFDIPPILFAHLVSRPAGWWMSPPREFPAKRWVEGRQRAGG